MANVLIIGATSSMGQLATKYFLNKTYDNITLMARYTGLLSPIDESRERVFQGDIIDEQILDDAMKGVNVVLVSLDSNEERLIQKIVDAMDKEGVKRLLFLTSMGVCNEIPVTAGASGNLTEASILKPYQEVIHVIEKSDLNYTIIRPSWLDDGKDVDNYEVVHNGAPYVENDVSRYSVADLIVRLAHNDKMGKCDNLAISRKAK
ncbi:NAD-dependent epimerase dehydratase [Companilactobacillus mindensis DSM 14500]|uniref:NAD-dependent epimerase dehydratase n=1 Tax=Companilactobacillus mindensis DSM 14500 TaxID=1423770 RepID=A0A0R1QKY0_9LACO|nr:NAD(P)H-binding protein [Companilactobacillus mindensis]KRL42610.1 NAD-dependent epimerase dehydratase [Companilactobacillus mindensis DSM 14500]GEO79136.1 NAD(P)-dependent oxidoreductase [Companilactobacillus mindensis]